MCIFNTKMEFHTWQLNSTSVKSERFHDEKTDSGINSCSEIHTSPDSDTSQDKFFSYSFPTSSQLSQSQFYLPQKASTPNLSIMQHSNHIPSPFNSFSSPLSSKNDNNNHKRNESDAAAFEMSIEKNCSGGTKSVCVNDEPGLRVPQVNCRGKVKTFKCRQCDFTALTKYGFWEHNKIHIKEENLLCCPKCPFNTKLKHHLEYHMLNHKGSKPFKCNKCNYSCVNKSMLNSHMKSHSDIYQYRCANCSYATKYCHSLKLHLRKYGHRPDMVLNPDGTPNPLPVIDVYGTRRGPKIKSQHTFPSTMAAAATAASIRPLTHPTHIPMPFTPPIFTSLLNSQLIEHFRQLLHERQTQAANLAEEEQRNAETPKGKSGALDLSKSDERTTGKVMTRNLSSEITNVTIFSDDDDDDDNDKGGGSDGISYKRDDVVKNVDIEDETINNNNNNNNNNNIKEETNTCQYCKIVFGDAILYTLHMGYHGYNNPFTCSRCGTVNSDKVSFFLHVARTPHF